MEKLAAAYEALCVILNSLRNPLLLAIRLYWGWQFATDGWGKLNHLDRVAEYFGGQLHLPAPAATALFVAIVEFAGGILFAAGIGSRLVSLVLFVNMTVAFLAAPDDRVNFSHILFEARGLLRSFAVYVLVCRAAHSYSWAGFVRPGLAGTAMVAAETRAMSAGV